MPFDSSETRDDRVAVRVGEVDEEPAARREVRRERHAEQTALAAADRGAAQIEEVLGDDAIADDADAAALLDGIEDRRIGGIGDEGDRRLQAAGEDRGAKRR